MPSKIKAVIVKLEKQRRALDQAIAALRGIEARIAIKTDPPGSFDDHEKNLIVNTLKETGGNRSEAARILRIGRDRLRYKMTKYKLL
jgi:DNA-binding NtrC family response regulator